jgi:dihydroorotase
LQASSHIRQVRGFFAVLYDYIIVLTSLVHSGVTTNSASGVVDYESFYPVFAEMERQDIILNIHGESPPSAGADITVLNAEERFLPTLKSLHQKFPKLRIILEHCTTAKAVEAVKDCGDNVAATITAHHLFLTIDNVVADPFCFCKPGKR